jgi:hypothetical protein
LDAFAHDESASVQVRWMGGNEGCGSMTNQHIGDTVQDGAAGTRRERENCEGVFAQRATHGVWRPDHNNDNASAPEPEHFEDDKKEPEVDSPIRTVPPRGIAGRVCASTSVSAPLSASVNASVSCSVSDAPRSDPGSGAAVRNVSIELDREGCVRP